MLFKEFPLGGATQSFKLLSNFQDYSSIKLREGAHGLELVSPLVNPFPTNEAWLILGQAKKEDKKVVPNQQMVWAAYRAALSASVKHIQGFDGSLESLIQSAYRRIVFAVRGSTGSSK